MARRAKIKSGKPVTVVFQKTSGSKKVWAKTFKSPTSAYKATKGIVSKTSNKKLSSRSAKGFKFGGLVRRLNRSK